MNNFSLVPFIVLLVIFIALLYKYLPETKGKTPKEVQDEFIRMTGGQVGDDVFGINDPVLAPSFPRSEYDEAVDDVEGMCRLSVVNI